MRVFFFRAYNRLTALAQVPISKNYNTISPKNYHIIYQTKPHRGVFAWTFFPFAAVFLFGRCASPFISRPVTWKLFQKIHWMEAYLVCYLLVSDVMLHSRKQHDFDEREGPPIQLILFHRCCCFVFCWSLCLRARPCAKRSCVGWACARALRGLSLSLSR